MVNIAPHVGSHSGIRFSIREDEQSSLVASLAYFSSSHVHNICSARLRLLRYLHFASARRSVGLAGNRPDTGIGPVVGWLRYGLRHHVLELDVARKEEREVGFQIGDFPHYIMTLPYLPVFNYVCISRMPGATQPAR